MNKPKPFLAYTRDHSGAINLWTRGPAFGLIWFDAHLDAHTPETSHTGNIHGMPIAALIGHIPPLYSEVNYLNPRNIIILGARSWESEEKEFLEEIGIQVIDNDGFKNASHSCFKYALEIATRNTTQFGISLDLDFFDPAYVGAVDVPVPNGFSPNKFNEYLPILVNHPKFVGMEISEWNRSINDNGNTHKIVQQIVNTSGILK